MTTLVKASAVLFLAGLLFAASGLGAAETRPEWGGIGDSIEETEGRGLVIRSKPQGAKVFIDGIERGTTPLRFENILPGRYFVRLEKDGYTERRFRITIRSGSLLEVSAALREAVGQVLIRVNPEGGTPGLEALPLSPRILADGVLLEGLVLTLAEGFRTIRVRAFGWEEASHTVYIKRDSVQELEFSLKPAAFRVSGASARRERFNPANSGSLGTTALVFEVSAPGRGTFSVLNSSGEIVFAEEAGPFTTWNQELVWDGRDSLGRIVPDGVYSLTLEARSPAGGAARVSLEITVNSSLLIHPLTLSSGKAGLAFAPSPAVLPRGSFQIEGSLLFGSPPESESPWTSLPFAGAFRFSPLDRLEVAGAANALPVFSGGVHASIAGSGKWVILNPAAGRRLAAAAGAVFTWTDVIPVSPFGAGTGIEIFLPLALALGGDFSLLLTPACIWTGDEGFPWEGAPRLLLSGGFILQKAPFTAGISARSEYRPWADNPRPPPLMMAGELKFFPPPSRFVFSLLGGLWIRGSSPGGFGGVGIGMIY
ncbi:MAG: PEGA domain-containing protein [Treponema sp.]|jgi:hypothetical protein|nr:PEGA domain-containing protein [Treponema sp.]